MPKLQIFCIIARCVVPLTPLTYVTYVENLNPASWRCAVIWVFRDIFLFGKRPKFFFFGFFLERRKVQSLVIGKNKWKY